MNNDHSTRQRRRRQFDPDPPPQPQRCAHKGCEADALYRAPKSRDKLNDYYWFCLEHVRDYNNSWDYYAGMGQAEIEKAIRAAVVGDRPTWRLGTLGTEARRFSFANGSRFDLFPEEVEAAIEARVGRARRAAEERARRQTKRRQSAEEQALAVLDLKPPVAWDEIRLRYKALVKRLHPDANGGDKAAEDQLKVVNQAYSTLKRAALA